ncbi:ribonuclease E/G [Marinivivus vitaminiproducens]|uniref:ribonuclease E/G n=1 Tax=Marinivivus vitaminiproducens TaxID=3035935 RepID=UPI00279C1B3D|nr:ribonuclease E/G [Geminicoccaceae bacterium SCSIO 64248]
MTRLLLDRSPFGARALVVDEGGPVAFGFADRTAGDTVTERLFLGRVTGEAAELDALFVDIGLDRPALLPLREIELIEGPRPAAGSGVIVQGRRPAREGKGPRVGADLALPGFGLVRHPRRTGLQVSARLGREARKALLARGRALFGAAAGLTLRAQAERLDDDRLRAEAAALDGQWRALLAQAARGRPGPLGLPAAPELDLLRRHLRPDTDRIEAEAGLLAAARRTLAEAGWTAGIDLAAADPTDAIEEALALAVDPVLPLAGGGRLLIEPTAALTAIDVDAGPAAGQGRDALNREAVEAAIRAAAQRNLGGTIVIDLVDPGGARAWAAVETALRTALARDPTPCRYALVRPMGLAVLSRARSGPSLTERLLAAGRAAPAWQAVRLWHALRRALPPAQEVRVAPDLHAFLIGPGREAWAAGLEELGYRPQISLGSPSDPDFELLPTSPS